MCGRELGTEAMAEWTTDRADALLTAVLPVLRKGHSCFARSTQAVGILQHQHGGCKWVFLPDDHRLSAVVPRALTGAPAGVVQRLVAMLEAPAARVILHGWAASISLNAVFQLCYVSSVPNASCGYAVCPGWSTSYVSSVANASCGYAATLCGRTVAVLWPC